MRSEYFSMKPTLAGSQSFFGQLPDDAREFGKGNPSFWICLCFYLLSPEGLFLKWIPFFFFYCDGSNHEYPLGNKLCEGSLAKRAINIGHMPHFNILVWNIGAKKPRKHFQKRFIVLALSWYPKQQAFCLSRCHHPGHELKTLQQSHGLISSPQDEQRSVNSISLSDEKGDNVSTKILISLDAMSLKASHFLKKHPVQMEQGMREGKLEARLLDMNWSLTDEGAELSNRYVSFQIYKSGHLLCTEF